MAYSVGVCARYQSSPKESHIAAVKRTIKYVSGTLDYGLWYSKDTNINLIGYSDAYCADNANDKKSTNWRFFLSLKQLDFMA